jgi:Ca2+-binding RTX toxin-like protein
MAVTNAWKAALAATLMASVQLVSAPEPAAAATTCDYTASNHKVRVVLSGGGGWISRSIGDHIMVNNVWCDGVATVYNTNTIVVLGGAGTQILGIHLDYGGFKPGFTNEPGTSDEIEISVSLGGDSDSLNIRGSGVGDNIVVGKSSGFAVLGRMNLNAYETTGVDADLTLIVGIEEIVLYGKGGNDTISGAGGAGTGDAATHMLKIAGDDGADTLTGGAVGDKIGGGQGTDVMKGGAGPDWLDAQDGAGGDSVYGGTGADTCVLDAGDSATSC